MKREVVPSVLSSRRRRTKESKRKKGRTYRSPRLESQEIRRSRRKDTHLVAFPETKSEAVVRSEGGRGGGRGQVVRFSNERDERVRKGGWERDEEMMG